MANDMEDDNGRLWCIYDSFYFVGNYEKENHSTCK